MKKVTTIKQQQGPDLHVWGSGNLIQTLIKYDLVDTFWLIIYPLTLGSGKRLFADGTTPVAFKVTESKVTPCGVIVVNYERTGEIKSESNSTARQKSLPRSCGERLAGISPPKRFGQ